MEKPVIIFGAKGIGKAAQQIFTSNGVEIYGFLDDDEELNNTQVNNIPVLGNTDSEELLKLLGNKCEAFIALEETKVRRKQVEILKGDYKVMPVNAIHKESLVPDSVYLGHGNMINAGVILGADSKIGNHCLLHTGAIIEHEAVIGDFVQIGPGSVVNPGVRIGDGAFIGSGVTIVAGVTIGKNAKVGAGSVVVRNVEKDTAVFGNPAEQVSV